METIKNKDEKISSADILKNDMRDFLLYCHDNNRFYARMDCREDREYWNSVNYKENKLAERFVEEAINNPDFISTWEYSKPIEATFDDNIEDMNKVNITASLMLKYKEGVLELDSVYIPFGYAEDGGILSFSFTPQNVDRQHFNDETMMNFFRENLSSMDVIVFDEHENNKKIVSMSVDDVEDLLCRERVKQAVNMVNFSEGLSFEEKFTHDIQSGKYTLEQARKFVDNPGFENTYYREKETKKWVKKANKALNKIEKKAEKEKDNDECFEL